MGLVLIAVCGRVLRWHNEKQLQHDLNVPVEAFWPSKWGKWDRSQEYLVGIVDHTSSFCPKFLIKNAAGTVIARGEYRFLHGLRISADEMLYDACDSVCRLFKVRFRRADTSAILCERTSAMIFGSGHFLTSRYHLLDGRIVECRPAQRGFAVSIDGQDVGVIMLIPAFIGRGVVARLPVDLPLALRAYILAAESSYFWTRWR